MMPLIVVNGGAFMTEFKKRLREAVAGALGQNDNSKAQENRPVFNFNAPVTIVVKGDSKKTLEVFASKLSKGGNDSQAPAYLVRRRDLLTNLPPYRH